MKLADKLIAHRQCRRYEKIIRQIRLRVFDYEDDGRGEKAARVLAKCKAICAEQWGREYRTRENERTQNYMM